MKLHCDVYFTSGPAELQFGVERGWLFDTEHPQGMSNTIPVGHYMDLGPDPAGKDRPLVIAYVTPWWINKSGNFRRSATIMQNVHTVAEAKDWIEATYRAWQEKSLVWKLLTRTTP